MHHGTKAVVALAVDPSGARLATGSIDYDVSFWDFAGETVFLVVRAACKNCIESSATLRNFSS